MTGRILDGLRKICLALPGAEETVSFGHPTFRAAGKTFCVLDEYKGEMAIAVKVGVAAQGIFLEDVRFYVTPYIGKHGWVSLRVPVTETAAKLNWEEIGELARSSYGLIAANAGSKSAGRSSSKSAAKPLSRPRAR
jgi:predicted DNA-binding protein (MmcQ/YjbR family)